MASGDEILICDSRDTDREGMRKLFDGLGYHCSATASGTEAAEMVARKFFPVAIVDLDVGRPGGGLEVMREIRERSAPTSLVLIATRRSFESAVDALRFGVTDVIIKRPEEVERLKLAVVIGCDRARVGADGENALLRDVVAVLDEAFRIVLDLGRKHPPEVSVGSPVSQRARILVVDGEQSFLQELAGLVSKKPWEVAGEMTGGAALDKAAQERVDIIAVRAELMDLRGSMVVKTLQAQYPDLVGLVYTSEGEGHVSLYRNGRAEEDERPFGGAAHLVKRLSALADQLAATQRDRRIIQAFRTAHADFFRRYAELKLRLARLLDEKG